MGKLLMLQQSQQSPGAASCEEVENYSEDVKVNEKSLMFIIKSINHKMLNQQLKPK